MTASKQQMEQETEQNKSAENVGTLKNGSPAADFSSELNEPRWSVITYETVAVSGLTYDEAATWMEKLDAQKVSGLCIVTDRAAQRFSA